MSRRQHEREGPEQKPVEIEEVTPATKVISSDPNWKYVGVRQRLTYIEESIDKGTQWVGFEPNGEPLWEMVHRVVSAFLLNVWRDGSLQGQKQEEAFFVKCDRTTMTQDDIDNGRLIVVVGRRAGEAGRVRHLAYRPVDRPRSDHLTAGRLAHPCDLRERGGCPRHPPWHRR